MSHLLSITFANNLLCISSAVQSPLFGSTKTMSHKRPRRMYWSVLQGDKKDRNKDARRIRINNQPQSLSRQKNRQKMKTMMSHKWPRQTYLVCTAGGNKDSRERTWYILQGGTKIAGTSPESYWHCQWASLEMQERPAIALPLTLIAFIQTLFLRRI